MAFDHLPCEQLARMAHKVLEHGEEPCRQLDGATGTLDVARGRIEPQIADLKEWVPGGCIAAQQGAEPCQQLVECEWLDEIIICAAVQATHTVAHRVTG